MQLNWHAFCISSIIVKHSTAKPRDWLGRFGILEWHLLVALEMLEWEQLNSVAWILYSLFVVQIWKTVGDGVILSHRNVISKRPDAFAFWWNAITKTSSLTPQDMWFGVCFLCGRLKVMYFPNHHSHKRPNLAIESLSHDYLKFRKADFVGAASSWDKDPEWPDSMEYGKLWMSLGWLYRSNLGH